MMIRELISNTAEFDLSFKVFHELMARKVTDILLISSPYEAFVMEEEGRLAERIIHEYRGLNLSRPPMLTWVSTADEALETLDRKPFDLVLTMPRVDETHAYDLARRIKDRFPELPVFMLVHRTGPFLSDEAQGAGQPIDRVYVWQGNSDLLLALIKNLEDRMNVAYDTQRAKVRVIILVEDSPEYYSALLPILYKIIVSQTQAVMEDSLNDEHRILRMRARPKILVAQTYEEAVDLYRRYGRYLLSVFSDVRFPRNGKMDDRAGFALLSMIREEMPDLPLLNLSSEKSNRQKALQIPAVFLNKESASLHSEISDFFTRYLGFGQFVFRLPSGEEVARASNLREMEKILLSIPGESVLYHARRNHFSSWLMARSEIMLASKLKPVKASDFPNSVELKHYLINCLRERRLGRQRGIVTVMSGGNYDPDADFVKIGRGSLGGKARGLAFLSTLLKSEADLQKRFQPVDIRVPKTLVVSTEGFDAFVNDNHLRSFALQENGDQKIARSFAAAPLPEWLQRDLASFIEPTDHPLAVRSSSLLEDAQFQPFAGLYRTYMLPNNHPDPAKRLERLTQAIKLVYASTYFEGPKSYAKNTFHRTEDEKMAVVIQQMTGHREADFFYPTVSGVAQSYNFYPMAHMKSEEGIAHIALGLGKTVVEGGTSLRFSPHYPQFLPQFSTVEDILQNSQRFFYALKLTDFPDALGADDEATLVRLELDDVAGSPAVKMLTSSYFPQEHRIRDGMQSQGYPVLTFAGILKYQQFPLADILTEILEMGRRGMGSPVEIEFAIDLSPGAGDPSFDLLQIRPMAVTHHNLEVDIKPEDIEQAVCYSTMALGNGQFQEIADIVFVKPEDFEPARTVEIAAEIGKINAGLNRHDQKYLLIGPGRWGSADRWLGIPVRWKDISGVGAIVETVVDNFKPDPSHGSHFFHNITSLGISYLTAAADTQDFLKWKWLRSLPVVDETKHLLHVRSERPLIIKIDGRHSRAVILPG